MGTNDWNWAQLNDSKIKVLNEAEASLGGEAPVLLAYQPAKEAPGLPAHLQSAGYQYAALNASQLERLKDLEKQIDAVIVAYTRRVSFRTTE